MLYRRGLAYRDEAVVNYDPVDGTVLANEQVCYSFSASIILGNKKKKLRSRLTQEDIHGGQVAESKKSS